MADVRITDQTIPLLSAARIGRITFDTNRHRFMLDGRYAEDDTSNTLVAMCEDWLITTNRATGEPGIVSVKPTQVGDDLLDTSMGC